MLVVWDMNRSSTCMWGCRLVLLKMERGLVEDATRMWEEKKVNKLAV